MNYNIVAHTEDSSYFDSCGDFNRQDGKFYHEYFTAEETFIANWADIIVEDYETVTIILDGVTDEYMNDEQFLEYTRLEKLAIAAAEDIRAGRARRAEEAKEAYRLAELERDKVRAELQHQADLQQLAALRAKLGV